MTATNFFFYYYFLVLMLQMPLSKSACTMFQDYNFSKTSVTKNNQLGKTENPAGIQKIPKAVFFRKKF